MAYYVFYPDYGPLILVVYKKNITHKNYLLKKSGSKSSLFWEKPLSTPEPHRS